MWIDGSQYNLSIPYRILTESKYGITIPNPEFFQFPIGFSQGVLKTTCKFICIELTFNSLSDSHQERMYIAVVNAIAPFNSLSDSHLTL